MALRVVTYIEVDYHSVIIFVKHNVAGVDVIMYQIQPVKVLDPAPDLADTLGPVKRSKVMMDTVDQSLVQFKETKPCNMTIFGEAPFVLDD